VRVEAAGSNAQHHIGNLPSAVPVVGYLDQDGCIAGRSGEVLLPTRRRWPRIFRRTTRQSSWNRRTCHSHGAPVLAPTAANSGINCSIAVTIRILHKISHEARTINPPVPKSKFLQKGLWVPSL
jgi:hypothetical protein